MENPTQIRPGNLSHHAPRARLEEKSQRGSRCIWVTKVYPSCHTTVSPPMLVPFQDWWGGTDGWQTIWVTH
jgi:hypothetical protein